MKRKLEITELIFKIISYTLLTIFALACLYPFVYTVASAISSRIAVEQGEVVLFPKQLQFEAFSRMFTNNVFWTAYSNTYVTADVVSTLAYRYSMEGSGSPGIGSAAEMMNNVIGMLLVIGSNTIARKATNTSLY